MSLGWNFPLSDEEYKTARNWKETIVYPMMLENQRGTRLESMWKVDSNTGAVTPYEGSIGGILSYHFYPCASLLCDVSSASSQEGRVVVHSVSGTYFELRPTSSSGLCCVPGPINESFFLTASNITAIKGWLAEKSIAVDSSDLSYVFAPTNLGVVTKAVLPTGEELDLTEYDDW